MSAGALVRTVAPADRARVMLVVETLGMGGMEQVVVTLARALDRDRFEPEILCLKEAGPLADVARDHGIPVHGIGYVAGRPDYLAFTKVARVLRERRVSVVHSHNTCAFIFGTLGARLAGVRTIVHTDHARAFPDRFRYMAAEYLLSHLVYRVVGVSAPTSEALHRHERIPRRKLVTVPNGIDRSRYTVALDRGQVRRALGIAPEARVIALAARLTEQKGLQYLLHALPAVIARHPDVVLLVAGDGPLRPALEALAAELGVAPHVRFLGMRDDIAALLRACDVYALPSVWEGLPMAVLEAMAAGLPVVGTDVGGVGTAVAHEVTGLLVPKRDPARLAEALVAVLGDRVLRRRLGDEARRVFERRFTAEAMARAYEALYLRAPAGGSLA